MYLHSCLVCLLCLPAEMLLGTPDFVTVIVCDEVTELLLPEVPLAEAKHGIV